MTLFKALTHKNKKNVILKKIKKHVITNKETTNQIINKLNEKSNIFGNIKSKKKTLTVLFDSCNIEYIIINYLFKINIFNNNVILNITNNKGNTLIYTTSGTLNYKSSHKTNKHSILKIINNILKNVSFFKNNYIGLHFNGNVKKFNKIVIKLLKTYCKINFIKSYNLTSHNGCRPKKLKRLKHFSVKKVFEGMTEWLK